jgi:hypothetical protein
VRLLLHAEPYGFGPSAAATAFAPGLLASGHEVAYAAEGHALDLHRGLPYAGLRDMTGADDAAWTRLLRGHDALLTATDERLARLALAAGLPVAFYDPLSWYWAEIPAFASRCLYVAQDFWGVRERLAREVHRAVVVPPLCVRRPSSRDGDFVLLNLGGLHNPHWPASDAAAYAAAMTCAVRAALPPGTRLEVAASSAVSRALGIPGVRPRDAGEMASLLASARAAFMTSGLGNLYDAAATGLPVCWLPPANGSQGQQLALLVREGMADLRIGWDDLGMQADLLGSQSGLRLRRLPLGGLPRSRRAGSGRRFLRHAALEPVPPQADPVEAPARKQRQVGVSGAVLEAVEAPCAQLVVQRLGAVRQADRHGLPLRRGYSGLRARVRIEGSACGRGPAVSLVGACAPFRRGRRAAARPYAKTRSRRTATSAECTRTRPPLALGERSRLIVDRRSAPASRRKCHRILDRRGDPGEKARPCGRTDHAP